MHEELFALQDALTQLDARGRGKRYPGPLKERIIDYVRQRREQGVTWATLTEQLGIPSVTLSHWLKPAISEQDEHDAAFVPVVVVGDNNKELVTLVAPNGWRIEGLNLERALRLLKANP